MSGPGRVKHNGRGDIVIGEVPRLAAIFAHAGIPCRVSPNIAVELWTKLVMNCAYNAISALTHEQYMRIRHDELAVDVMKDLIAEVVAVGSAAGVTLPSAEVLTAAALKLGESMSTGHVLNGAGHRSRSPDGDRFVERLRLTSRKRTGYSHPG
jgi:2-dehydropantoate 2-reductase